MTKVLMAGVYALLAPMILNRVLNGASSKKALSKQLYLHPLEKLYLWGLIGVYCISFALEWRLGRDVFLPLMLISVYCALGVTWSFQRLHFLFLNSSSPVL